MAETAWALNDSDPGSVAQAFAASPAERAWTLADIAPLATDFEAPPAAWTQVYWGGAASLLFDASQGGQTYAETGSGTVVLGGSSLPTVLLRPAASGGAVIGGSIAVSTVAAPSATGGAVTGGAGTPALVVKPTITGGIQLGGAPNAALVAGPGVSGGVTISGNVTPAQVYVLTGSGSVVPGGSSQPAAPDLPYSGEIVVKNLPIPPFSGGVVNTGAVFGRVGARMGKLSGKGRNLAGKAPRGR